MDIGKNLQESFNLYMKNFAVLFVSTLLATLLTGVTFGILAGPMFAGLFVIASKLLKGENAEIGEVFSQFDKFGPTFILSLLFAVAFIVLFIINLIPLIGFLVYLAVGPILGLVYFMALGFIIERKSEPIEAIKMSIEKITKSKEPIMIWVYCLVFGIIGGIGAWILGITVPIGILGLLMAYQQLSADQAPGSEPSIPA